MSGADCRSCGEALSETFVDLGTTPLANSYVSTSESVGDQPRYPLHAFVCTQCFLVQLGIAVPPAEIFSDYAYFSSFSSTWVDHARRLVHDLVARFELGADDLLVEVASNDGYLLRHAVDLGVRVLGIEPAANVAKVAVEAGVETEVAFFGRATAERLCADGRLASALIANNVLAHVPDLNDFVGGIAELLRPDGVLVAEFPHLLNLVEGVQFDTIYHEHYSYFSILALEPVLNRHGLRLFDVQPVPTHGGSLRIFAAPEAAGRDEEPSVAAIRSLETSRRLDDLATYRSFGEKAEAARDAFLGFLAQARADGRRVAAYGAAAKGNTLLNYCGVTADDIEFVVDRNPHKQDHRLPGSGIPVFAPEHLWSDRPDVVVILPWNLADEIAADLADVREWGGQLVVPLPEPRVIA